MKSKKKSKGIFATAMASALAIGVFSVLFIGANRLTFAAADGRTVTQEPTIAQTAVTTPTVPATTPQPQQTPPATENVPTAETAVFVPPTVTLIPLTNLAGDTPPAHALSMEEAFLIGAEYIWDVLGSCIDGMYVEMMYTLMPGFTRPFWIGTVSATKPPQDLNFEDFRDDLDAWRDAMVFSSYIFRLDAITGMRVDVGYMDPSHLEMERETDRDRPVGYVIGPANDWEGADDCAIQRREMAMRHWDFRTTWFEMEMDEQLAHSDITPERLEVYTQTALELAERHFNSTTVQNIQLGDAWVGANTFFTGDVYGEGDDRIMIITGITFTATDHTGREVIVMIPTENAGWRRLSVSSMHNEFIPGFNYDPENRNLAR